MPCNGAPFHGMLLLKLLFSNRLILFSNRLILFSNRLILFQDGRVLSDPFIKLPTRRQLPDYYDVIKHPVDINKMLNKIDDGKVSLNRRDPKPDIQNPDIFEVGFRIVQISNGWDYSPDHSKNDHSKNDHSKTDHSKTRLFG